MHVLMYEPSGQGGLTEYTRGLCGALARDGVEVTWLTAASYREPAAPGVEVMRSLPSPDAASALLRFRPYWAAARVGVIGGNAVRRNRLARRLQPDLTHLQYLVPRLEQYLMDGLRRQGPVVLTVHDVVPHAAGPHWSDASLEKVYREADHLIVHTESNLRELRARFGVPAEKASVVFLGAEPQPYADPVAARRRLGLAEEEKVLLFFGTIRRNKGLDLLLDAFRLVRCEEPRSRLLVAGGMPFGEDFSPYRSQIDSSGLTKAVSLHVRFVDEDEIPAFFAASDLVVLPYRDYAAQSAVLLRAYASGRPVVVTDGGGMGELVAEDGVGEVARPDAEDLAGAILKMLQDEPRLRAAAEAARQAADTKYSWPAAAAKTRAVYERVLARGAR